MKRILSSEWVRRFFCSLAALYTRFVFATSRWTTEGFDHPQRLIDAGKPFIVAFWHGRLLMMPFTWTRQATIHMLISEHRDGDLIARTVDWFGIRSIRGSTRRRGTAALRHMLKKLKAGDCIGMTPDGPRGPRMRASDGIVTVARLAGVPILPASYGVNRRRVLSTWDRFIVALPFSRGTFVWGTPIEVPAKADEAAMEEIRQRVEDSLNQIAHDIDTRLGVLPIGPAPPPAGEKQP